VAAVTPVAIDDIIAFSEVTWELSEAVNVNDYQQNTMYSEQTNEQLDRQWRSSSFQDLDISLILILEGECNGASLSERM